MYTGFGSFPAENVIPDTVNGAKSVRDLYDISNKNTGVQQESDKGQLANSWLHFRLSTCH